MSLEEKMEADARSIYVGNVCIKESSDLGLGGIVFYCFVSTFPILVTCPFPQVDYGATAEELEAHFHGCGSVNRVTILCDKFSGHPKG